MVESIEAKKQGSHLTERGQRGFTLIELLIVVNIVIYFLWLVAPSFNSIAGGLSTTEAAYTISSAVERARSEAIARKSYVWLGIQQEVVDGSLALRLGTVCSMDGRANTNASNLLPLGKTLLIPRVGLINASSIAARTGAPTNGGIDLSGFSDGMNFQIGQTKFLDGRTITFMPLGEVTTNPVPTSSSGFDPFMMIGLRTAHGTQLFPGDDVSVVIDGSVGTPAIYRK